MQLEQLFSDALGIPVEQVSDVLSYQGIPQWDSVAHMGLIAQLEDWFGYSPTVCRTRRGSMAKWP